MHIIKPCPSCGRNLRFPVNKGKIRVTCACGSAFIADPDDPKLFANASFDIGAGKKKSSPSSPGARLRRAVDSVINSVLSFTYKTQNFRLLPTIEKAQVLLVIFIVVVLVAAALIYFLYHPGKQPDRPSLI